MKAFKLFCTLLPAMLLMATACSKDNGTPKQKPEVSSGVTISATKNEVNKGDVVYITLTDKGGQRTVEDVTFNITPDANAATKLPKKTAKGNLQLLMCKVGKFTVTATTETGVSNPIEINVTAPPTLTEDDENELGYYDVNGSNFTKKVWNYKAATNPVVLKLDKPTLIKFGAEWCGPCHVVRPYLADIAKKYEGKVYVVETDIDKTPGIMNLLGRLYPDAVSNAIPIFWFLSPYSDDVVIFDAIPNGDPNNVVKIADEYFTKELNKQK